MDGASLRTAVRAAVVPAALAVGVALTFHRAFAPVDLARAAALGVVFGGLAGWSGGATRLPWPVRIAASAVALGVGASLAAEALLALDLIPDATAVFLTVGLPARGLTQVLVVPFMVVSAAMATAVAASRARRTLATLAGPVVAVAVAAFLVEPVGFGWWVPLAIAGPAGAVLILDARNDLSRLPALVSTNTESRRQLVWWRPLVQVVPALLAVTALATALPQANEVDVRRFVRPKTERIADASPLAVAARVARTGPDADDVRPLRSVLVDGPSPGRLRLAVLDAYSSTGWKQSADFGITGEVLAPDPLFATLASRPAGRLPRPTATVTVGPLRSPIGLQAVPTGGVARSVDRPDGVRFADRSGLLLDTNSRRSLQYVTEVPTEVAGAAGSLGGDANVGQFPTELIDCPASPVVAAIATQLSGGVPGATARLDRIENFLKVRRVYDPVAPGGQTLRSIERFLEQDFARGNLEVFVTSYALLARCAGVPVRVVIGLPAPATGTNRYQSRDLTAWVETPLVRSGWVARDPLPTPDEQRQQAQLARQAQPPPPPEPKEQDPAPPLQRVTPKDFGSSDRSRLPLLVLSLLGLGVLVAIAWTVLAPLALVRRRRRTEDPAAAVHAAWATVAEALADRSVRIDVHHTPSEVVRLASGFVPVTVPRLLHLLVPLVDRARYDREHVTATDAGLAWGYAGAVLERLPMSASTRLAPARRPKREAAHLRATLGVIRRRQPWDAVLPASAVMSSDEAPPDILNVAIAARIGEGATGTVYRGALAGRAEQVAIKVFRYGPGDAGFDQPRYDWEVRIAGEVSGLPHLPMVHAAGITPLTNRPYLVTSLYEDGTLLDRIRRGGPMTEAEAVAIGTDVAIALATLHQLGVVHADVKPENVFSGPDGWVLGDLGSAWLRASKGPAASLTPPYAAPEVWRGASPTPRADLYSLALTMLYAATAQVPIASNPPAREDVLAAFPEHPVMVRALEPDARRRPRSVPEFLRLLRPDLAPSGGSRLEGLSLPTPTVSHRRG